MKRLHTIIALCLLATTLWNCQKDESLQNIDDDLIENNELKGIYVLSEGLMNASSAITYYDIEKDEAVEDYFLQVNGYDLGETANDLKRYGTKMYCVVSGVQGGRNSYLEVIDVASGKSLKRIPFFSETEEYLPRFVDFYQNKAYISGYDGKITRVDTASLTIDGRVEAGGALEELAIVNDKIYVTNSDHWLHPGVNNSVSVVDILSFTKLSEIEVTLNPTRIKAIEDGRIAVSSMGNYDDISAKLTVINSTTDGVEGVYDYEIAHMAAFGNQLYVAGDVYGNNPYFKSFDISSGHLGDNFITDESTINIYYGITVNQNTGDILVADAVNFTGVKGSATYFGQDGKHKFDFATGVSPQHAVFVYDN